MGNITFVGISGSLRKASRNSGLLRCCAANLPKGVSLEIADIRDADVHGSGIITGQVESAARWRILLQKMQQEGVPFSASALNCSGADIMNWLSLPASPAVGKIKAALLIRLYQTQK